MTEQELRALVRTAIARVRVTAPLEPSHPTHPSHLSHLSHLSHPSHLTLAVLSGADIEGPCIIEPAVMCNHCGYCKSMGH
jgi:hypothetical protein